MKNKKVVYIIIGIVSIALIALAITYAYWQITKSQTNSNVVSAACLDISISNEQNDISLQNQYPISDTEGAELTPYTFTVTNNCDTEINYQVALELTGDSSTSITATSMKYMLNDKVGIIGDKTSVEPTISGAYASYKLGTGTLAAKDTEGSSVSYELRIWIDYDASVSEANKTFTSKISVTAGEGIEVLTFDEGSLAYTLIEASGGEYSVGSLSLEKEDKIIESVEYFYFPATMSVYWGTDYELDETTGNYKLAGTIVESTLTDCRSGTNMCGNYTLFNQSSETATDTYIMEVTDFGTSEDYVMLNARFYTTDFGIATTEDDAGMYKAQDDYGTSYYYRGNVTNNYVQFGSYVAGTTVNGTTYSEITPMYWRVVRVNGDGTIRMIYAGTSKVANGESNDSKIASVVYNQDFNNKMYVGYMYGTEEDPYGDDESTTLTDSTIKDAIDTWYEANLKTNYETYIADSIFCNDREEYSDEDGDVTYKNYNRLHPTHEPILTCSNKRDRFTVNDTTLGNGHLTNPVGLLTADELVMTGHSFIDPASSDCLSGSSFWTSSPGNFDGLALMFVNSAEAAGSSVNAVYDARPVINLKADVEFTVDEDGTYVITTK